MEVSQMKTRFACNEFKPGCGFSVEDEQREVVERKAQEHLKTAHPEDALEADRARATLDAFLRPV
jgi:predicted small metal-binding protein